MSNLPLFDQTIFAAVNNSEEAIEHEISCDLLYFFGEIRSWVINPFRGAIEQLAKRRERKDIISICLTTPGGEAETVEKLVEIIRHHYTYVYFIVPSAAFSAGTIFCMSGDKIYMDYSSSLGPIDPQVPDKDGKYLVPALGYLEKVSELVEKSKRNDISPAEIAILMNQDLATLRLYEQAKELSIELLTKWLAKYKFKDWHIHSTTDAGSPVTDEQKGARATEIATLLSNSSHWHSHGRRIGINTLRNELRLKIDDYDDNKQLSKHIRIYGDTLTEYLQRHNHTFYLHNRHINT